MFLAHVYVTLKPGILDPQGKTVHHALENLGFESVKDVRIGKYIQMKIGTGEEAEAARIVQASCEKLLANPVIETFRFELEPIDE